MSYDFTEDLDELIKNKKDTDECREFDLMLDRYLVPGLTVTVFERPNGARNEVVIQNIRPEDANFFISNNLDVSMEELTTGEYVIYSTYPCEDSDEDDPAEVTYVVPYGMSCEDAMHELRKIVQGYL